MGPNELPNPHKINPKSVAVTIAYSSMLNFDFCNTSHAKCSFLLFQQVSEFIQFHSELLFQCIRNLDCRNVAVCGSILMDFRPQKGGRKPYDFLFLRLWAPLNLPKFAVCFLIPFWHRFGKLFGPK